MKPHLRVFVYTFAMIPILGTIFFLAGIAVVVSYLCSEDSKRTDEEIEADSQRYSL